MGSTGLFIWVLASMAANHPSILLHELGHAAVALQQTSGPVLVQVGSTQGARRMTFGRLTLSLSLHGCGGVCVARNDRPLSRASMLKRVLAGPGVNLVLALLFAAIVLRTHGLIRTGCAAIALINALTVVMNLVPRYATGGVNAGRPNDGLKAWYLLRAKPVPLPAAPKTQAVKSTMKTCPSCGAHVHLRARLCYCYHEFS